MYNYKSCSDRIYRTKSKYLVLQPLLDKYISIQQLDIDFMSTVNESPLNGPLIYLPDKNGIIFWLLSAYSDSIIYDFICAMCMGCAESCVCCWSDTEIHWAIVRHSIGFVFVCLDSCY